MTIKPFCKITSDGKLFTYHNWTHKNPTGNSSKRQPVESNGKTLFPVSVFVVQIIKVIKR